MTTSYLIGLDPDEIAATRENLESAVELQDGPAGKRVPLTLCTEIEKILHYFELAVRAANRPTTN